MDATIYQIIFGELGDLNCSLIDAFQDTFLENASLSLLSTDGKMECLHFSCSMLRGVFENNGNYSLSVRLFFVLLYFLSKVYIAMPQPMRLEPAGHGAAPGGL